MEQQTAKSRDASGDGVDLWKGLRHQRRKTPLVRGRIK
jgi:hypothetical protein